jgi:hypothetical protein
VDCQASLRSLLSHILLCGGGGDGEGGFECQVRLLRLYDSGRREDRKDGATNQQGDMPQVKVVEQPLSEMPIETLQCSLGVACVTNLLKDKRSISYSPGIDTRFCSNPCV